MKLLSLIPCAMAFSKIGPQSDFVGRAQYTVFRKMFLEYFQKLENSQVPTDQLYKTFNYGCFCRNIIKPVDEAWLKI